MKSLRFRSLEGRIATLFLLLIITVQVAGLIVIQRGIDNNARASIGVELVNGEKVFRKLMEQAAQTRRSRANVLALDTGFKDAIGSADIPTIKSALDNSRGRAKASLALFVNGEREVAITIGAADSPVLNKLVLGMLDRAEASGASAVAVVDHKPYQIVVVPVRAPVIVGWIVFGFAIDQQMALDMKDLSELEVVVLTREGTSAWQPIETTLSRNQTQKVATDLQSVPELQVKPFDLDINGARYSGA